MSWTPQRARGRAGSQQTVNLAVAAHEVLGGQVAPGGDGTQAHWPEGVEQGRHQRLVNAQPDDAAADDHCRNLAETGVDQGYGHDAVRADGIFDLAVDHDCGPRTDRCSQFVLVHPGAAEVPVVGPVD
jgi:hypothetical protein